MGQSMESVAREQIKAKIVEDLGLLGTQIQKLEAKTKPIEPDCSLGRLTRLEAMGEQHVNHTILDEEKMRLRRLENALLRIDKPSFGVCVDCEEDIIIERMMIRPESVRCVACANKRQQSS